MSLAVRTRRDTELLLLLAAMPVIALAFALVHGASDRTVAWTDLAVPGGLLGAFLVAHAVARRFARNADPAVLPIAALLSGVGLAFLTRLDPALATAQVLWLFAGVAVMAATLVLVPSLETLARYKYTTALAGVVLLLLPAVIGREVNGAKLWLRVGGMSFQPAEVAKILLVLFFAAYLSENREVLSVSTKRVLGVWLPPARRLGPLLAMWAVSLVVLVAERDLGSSLLFFGVFLVMIYAATGRPAYVLVGLGLFGAGASAAYAVFTHVQSRIAIWLDPFADAAGRGYQLVQSLFALGAGGMLGTGIGHGFPGRIPFVATDFIFTAIAEEIGLLGGAALILAYFAQCARGMATAVRARSDMNALTAAGLVATLGLQTFVIVGGVTRLIPLTGITLPFVSYGGSSMLSNFILLALLMRAGDAPRGEEVPEAGLTGALGRVALALRVRGVTGALSLLFVALIVNLTWVQVFQADALAANPANTRGLAEEMARPRGDIVTSDGKVLARSVKRGDAYEREYPQGPFASHVLGYWDAKYGRAGIEAAMNDALLSERAYSNVGDLIDEAAGVPVPGNDVVLTLDSRVQEAAEAALAGHRGAVVVLDPRTGAVLALASAPDFDPREAGDILGQRTAVAGSPLTDRATDGLYPPGSTFKTVTLTGALGEGTATPATKYPGPGRMEIGGADVTNFEGGSYGPIDLKTALAKSVNTVFAQLAVDLGAERLVGQAKAFGFGERPPIETGAKASLMPDPKDMTTWELAWAGVGQPVGEHDSSPAGPQVTPLQMALVAAGIGNGGAVMRPYVVEAVRDDAGRALTETKPRLWTRATDSETAATVRDLMVNAVANGSGSHAAVPGVKVAGKTGTAEVGKGQVTHAWFIGFAPADSPRVAIAVVLENAGVGGRVAAPAAGPVIEAALAATK